MCEPVSWAAHRYIPDDDLMLVNTSLIVLQAAWYWRGPLRSIHFPSVIGSPLKEAA